MNVRKFDKQACGHVFKHYAREVALGHYSNADIQEEKTPGNYNLCEADRPSQMEYLEEMLSKIDHVNRKDLVCMASIIVNAPKTLHPSIYEAFFRETYNFLIDRYGRKYAGFENPEDVCISSFLHQDEAGQTPHCHFSFLPILFDEKTGRQRFCAKEVISRDDLKTLHKDLQDYLAARGIRADILNGATQYDAYGRAVSVRELKRAERERTRDRSITTKGRF